MNEQLVERVAKATNEALRDVLGEAFHTAFRKAADHPKMYVIWKAISALPDNVWGEVLDFVILCVGDELARAALRVVRQAPSPPDCQGCADWREEANRLHARVQALEAENTTGRKK